MRILAQEISNSSQGCKLNSFGVLPAAGMTSAESKNDGAKKHLT